MVQQTLDWDERAEKLKNMSRMNYNQYLELKEEEKSLLLFPTVELPEIMLVLNIPIMNRLRKQQKAWSDHVHRLATLYLALHESEEVDTVLLSKRKKDSDVNRLLEEEKDIPYFMEEDVTLLKEMKV